MSEQKLLGVCLVLASLILGAAILYHAHRPESGVGRYQFQPSTPPGVIWVIDTTTGEVKTR